VSGGRECYACLAVGCRLFPWPSHDALAWRAVPAARLRLSLNDHARWRVASPPLPPRALLPCPPFPTPLCCVLRNDSPSTLPSVRGMGVEAGQGRPRDGTRRCRCRVLTSGRGPAPGPAAGGGGVPG
jgi:hypothetical protein